MSESAHAKACASEDLPGLVYADEQLVAIYKPAGWLVHRSEIDRDETRIAMLWLRDHLGRRVHPLHRLDKPTAGLLLFALDPLSAASMERQFAAGRVRKQYLGVVRGHLPDAGRIDYALSESRRFAAAGAAARPAQAAVTDYLCRARAELPVPVRPYASSRYSLLQLMPHSGRTHQLRRHLKHVFHPLIGDTSYGDGHHNRAFRQRFDCHRLLLAATALAFEHPLTAAPVCLRVAPDPELQSVLAALGWMEPGWTDAGWTDLGRAGQDLTGLAGRGDAG